MFFKKIFNFFGFCLTKDQKIERAKRYYKDNPTRLALAIFRLEGLDEIKNPKEWYEKLVKLCAKHSLNYEIPN